VGKCQEVGKCREWKLVERIGKSQLEQDRMNGEELEERRGIEVWRGYGIGERAGIYRWEC
jgi:hypothetical protein